MKNLRTLLFICLALVIALAAPAQVTVSAPAVPNFNANSQQFPYNVYTVVVTGTGNATFSIPGFSSGTMEAFGTYTAATVVVSAANDGSTNGQFANLSFIPAAGGSRITTFTGANTAINGLYAFNASGKTQIKVTSSGTFTGTSLTLRFTIHAAAGFPAYIPLPAGDPCQDPYSQKVPIAISGTAPNTVKAIPLAAGKQTYVCDMSIITGTGATSVTVSAGTGTTCGTGNVPLTGAMGITVGQQLFFGWGGTIFGPSLLPSANDVCVAVAGGTAAYAGYAVVVQQ